MTKPLQPLALPNDKINKIFNDPAGQTSLYQTENRYTALLTARFGDRFIAYRRRWEETAARGDPGDFPLSLDLAVNSGCQLRCLMCPRPKGPDRPLPPAIFERLMAQAEEQGTPALTLGLGSEPLLRPDLPRLTARAVRAGIMDIRLGSNGLGLTAPLARALAESGLTRLEISVDAARPATYRRVRGGDLADLERKLEIFLEQRRLAGSGFPLLRLSFLKLAENRGEEAEFLARFGPLADMIALQEPIWFPGTRLPAPAGPSLAAGCGQPWQRLAVDWEGRLWPCCSWAAAAYLPYNAGTADLAQVWRSPEMEALRRSLQEAGGGGGGAAPCRDCRLLWSR